MAGDTPVYDNVVFLRDQLRVAEIEKNVAAYDWSRGIMRRGGPDRSERFDRASSRYHRLLRQWRGN